MIVFFSNFLSVEIGQAQYSPQPIFNQANDVVGNPIDKPVQTVNEQIQIIGKPTNQIKIPGLSYTEVTEVEENDGVYLYVPFIGEYLSVVYRYLVVLAGVAALIVIIVAGIQWTASGGNSSTIESAKNRIVGALTGLGLAVGSYIILYTINPDLVNFKSLKIKYIEPEPIENLTFLSAEDYKSITGNFILPPEQILQKAIEVTKTVGLDDQCYMITIIGKESGGNPAAIGHDENYPRPTCVGARKDFLLSGVRYSKTTFVPPVKTPGEYRCALHNGTKLQTGELLKNDDKFNPNSPPDYGLDWRFTHGFGLGQVTLRPNHFCNGQRGINKYGKCFNIPELLTVDAAAFFAANLFKDNLKCAENKGYNGPQKIQAAFWAYAAGCGNVEANRGQDISMKPGVPRAWDHYLSCRGATMVGGTAKFEKPDPTGGVTEK
jgi:hypothetical protein